MKREMSGILRNEFSVIFSSFSENYFDYSRTLWIFYFRGFPTGNCLMIDLFVVLYDVTGIWRQTRTINH
jgi:hypothetical protein